MVEFYGTQGDDTITGTQGDDFINGLDGNDTLFGLGGADRLLGSGGADIVDGGAGDDIISNDFADGVVDVLTGGTGADRFVLGVYTGASPLTAPDRITDFSMAGGDRLDIGVVDGTLGGLRYLRWAGPVTTPGFTLTAGQSLANSAAGLADVWTWTNAGTTWLIVDRNDNETLDNNDLVIAFNGTPALGVGAFVTGTFTAQSGTSGNDTFTGSIGPDIYFALEGDDTASGAGGDDQIYGGTGADNLAGDDGNDLLVGETGNDVLHGGIGDDQLYAGMRYTSVQSDLGTTNQLYGEDGDDALIAGEGRDLLDGGVGADSLSSREDDTANGGDTLLGGDGADTFSFNGDLLVDGGAGDDIFYFGEIGSTVVGGIGADRFDLIQTGHQGNFDLGRFHLITDFNHAEGDRLSLGLAGHYQQTLMFRGALDNPDFSLEAGQSFSSSDYGSDLAQIWTWAAGGETFMIVDLDGSGTLTDADYVVRFSGSPVLSHSAFVPGALVSSLSGTEGADVIQGTESFDLIYGLAGNDVIHGAGGNDELYGNAGDDEIHGGAGYNEIHGGDGDDVLTGGDGGVIYGGAGSDIIHGGIGGGTLYAAGNHPGDVDAPDDINLIYGSDARDLIFGGLGPLDQSFGNGGDDVVNGGGLVEGGAGNDQLSSAGALATTLLDGGAGDDTINSGDFGDRIVGGDGADKLSGHGGDDEILGAFDDLWMNGDDGHDILRVSGQAAESDPALYIRGGQGFDVADFSEAAGYLTLVLGAPGEQETGLGRVYIEGVEHVIAASAGSHITGSDGADHLEGRAGVDTLIGGGGDDLIDGGAGDDLITGGLGDDRIDGGAGDDVLNVSGAASDYRLLLDGDDFILKGPDGGDHLTGVETIRFADGRMLELNRMYGPAGGVGADGIIPDHLLSPGPGEPPAPPPPADKAGDGDAFVLPPLPDDQPLVLPGVETDKFADDPMVLPGTGEERPHFPNLEAHLPFAGDWILPAADGGLPGGTHYRDDWIG